MTRWHIPSVALFASYAIPIVTFVTTFVIAMNTPRLHEPFDGMVMWVYHGDYHLSTSISHGLSRRIGCLGLSLSALVFLFVVLNKIAYMHYHLKNYHAEELKLRESLLWWLQMTGISSSVFMIFVCSFPESEGLVMHLICALLYFGSNMAYQYLYLKVDEVFSLHTQEPILHRLRQSCFIVSLCCLCGVVVSLVGFDNMTISSGLEIVMAVFMLAFYCSLHSQYSNINIHSYIIAVDHQNVHEIIKKNE
mmetsp:Transcript_34554/g.35224  ORF Transcript_34554/g.35224 Transcript_34554/m.35224 type:complete len:249 (+) Transcript_34554:268-1014(+)